MNEVNLEKIIGLIAVTAIVALAVSEGLNGKLIIAGLVSIIAIAAPKQLDKLRYP